MSLKTCINKNKVGRCLKVWTHAENSNYPGTNLLFSPPGLLGRASISIGPQAEAATGLTTGTPDQAPLLEDT